MSLINTTLQTLNLRMRDMIGYVSMQRLHSRIFDAYEVKSLVLESMSEDQQRVLVANGGSIPPLHPIGQPLVIESWPELVAQHRETNLYQLQPRRARSHAAYSVMRAVCASRGTPFSFDDRTDPIDCKLVFRPPDFEFRNAFNARNPEKVGTLVQFDGLLRTERDTGVMYCFPHVTPAQINNIVGTVAFLREWSADSGDTERHRELKTKWGAMLSRRTHQFIGSQSALNKEVLAFAKAKNVHLFVRKGASYVYTPRY